MPRRPRFFALILVLFLASSSALAEETFDIRLGDDVVPTFQKIHLKLDADQKDYSGSVFIELEVRKEVSTFMLHSEGPEIQHLGLTHEGKAIAVESKFLADDVLEITAEKKLVKGKHQLEIRFTNEFDTKATSLYRADVDGAGYTFTQFEADDAREAFPCFDEPRFKIPYQMTLTVPQAHVAIANMPIDQESDDDGWRTTVYAKSPPMPSYLLALATGPFDLVDMPGLGVPARIVTVKGQSHLTSLALEVTPPILKALEKYFDRPYPYRKLDFIAVPEFWPGAMENPGAITYTDRLLIIDPARATVGQRRAQAVVIAHELAHQWFGNLVTMEWWDDLWLNESFADWMANKITHKIFPDLGIALSSSMSGQRIMVSDARETSGAIRKPVNSTDNMMQDVGLAYSKGKTVLAMFETWLGEEKFRLGVLDYLKTREWKNATAADLFSALAKASGKPLGSAMATFTDQPGVPRVRVEPHGDGTVTLSQGRFRNYGSNAQDQLWRVPVVLRFPHGESTRQITAFLESESMKVDLGIGKAPAWIHPNADSRGYYRWSLAKDQLEALAANGLGHLAPAERINLVSNAAALLQAGEINGGTFLSVLTRLAGDQEPMVVSAVLNELGPVETAFVPDDLKPAYGAWLQKTFKPALDQFGIQKAKGEQETVALLRPRLLRLLSEKAEDASVVAFFKDQATSFLKDPASVDPSLAGLALQVLASDGDLKLFEDLQSRAEAAKTPQLRGQFLSSLGAFKDEALQDKALAYAMTGPIRPNEIFAVIGGIARTEEGQDKLFRAMLDNWDLLGEKLPPQFRSFLPRIADGCSKDRLQVAETFFGKPEHQGPGVERSMERVRETVGSCVSLRERESASVEKFLRALEG